MTDFVNLALLNEKAFASREKLAKTIARKTGVNLDKADHEIERGLMEGQLFREGDGFTFDPCDSVLSFSRVTLGLFETFDDTALALPF